MGFLSALKGLVGDVQGAISGEVAKFKNADAVNASLAIVALVAGADGEVEPEERKAGANFVRNGDLFRSFDRAKLASSLETYYGKATDDILKGDLFDVIAKVKNDPAASLAVLKVGVGIAKADGEFEDAEREVLLEVCTTLGVNPKEVRGLAA